VTRRFFRCEDVVQGLLEWSWSRQTPYRLLDVLIVALLDFLKGRAASGSVANTLRRLCGKYATDVVTSARAGAGLSRSGHREKRIDRHTCWARPRGGQVLAVAVVPSGADGRVGEPLGVNRRSGRLTLLHRMLRPTVLAIGGPAIVDGREVGGVKR